MRLRLPIGNGTYPDPKAWLRETQKASAEAEARVMQMKAACGTAEQAGLSSQRAAALSRLDHEGGRYLIALGAHAGSLREYLAQQVKRPDTAGGRRLHEVITKRPGYPVFAGHLDWELSDYSTTLSSNDRRGRVAGSEVDAALDDPRL